jgi:hypothetical protein
VSVTVSPQLRLLALVGLIAVVGGAAAMLLMGRSGSGSAAPKVIKPLHPVAKHAAKPKTATKAPTAKKTVAKHPAKPAVHKAAPKKAATPKAPVVTVKGLPASLVAALTAHPVAVVALYQVERTSTAAERLAARTGSSPGAAVGIDRLALAEAQAGAHDAHAGFVGVDVFRRADAEPLTKLLGVLQDPAVLVFKRPGTVFVQLNGYADRDTIAQAATNAALQQ